MHPREHSKRRLGGKSIAPPSPWEGSTNVDGHRLYGVSSSHLSLASHISPSHINTLDFRHLVGPTHQSSCNKEAAFTRSDATTGWNFATTPDSRSLKQLLTRSLASSIKNSKDHTTALKDYRTPQQNAAAVADKIKTAHLEAVQQVTALEAKFGKEGAAEVIRIARMPQTHNNHSHQASKRDLEAVAELDSLQDRLLSDSV